VSSFGDREWLRPQDPFLVHGALYVPLVSVTANSAIEGPFKFEIAGHRLARMKDFSGADPHRWHVEYLDMFSGIVSDIKAFATTSVVHGGYVYFCPLYSATAAVPGVLGNILARIPVEKLNKPAEAIEYLRRGGRWRKRVDPATVATISAMPARSTWPLPGAETWLLPMYAIH
jgi:hypothetical protein